MSVQKIHGSPQVASPLWNVYVAMVAISCIRMGIRECDSGEGGVRLRVWLLAALPACA